MIENPPEMDDSLSKCQCQMVNRENVFVDRENLKFKAMTVSA